MKLLSRTALALVALVVFILGSATAASADAIDPASPVLVGTFNFVSEQCDQAIDPFCESFEYFSLTNDLATSDPLYGGLTFFATVDLGGAALEFIDLFRSTDSSAGRVRAFANGARGNVFRFCRCRDAHVRWRQLR